VNSGFCFRPMITFSGLLTSYIFRIQIISFRKAHLFLSKTCFQLSLRLAHQIWHAELCLEFLTVLNSSVGKVFAIGRARIWNLNMLSMLSSGDDIDDVMTLIAIIFE
jgi:hypothetical protein